MKFKSMFIVTIVSSLVACAHAQQVSETGKLVPPDGAPWDFFGRSIEQNEKYLVIASMDTGGSGNRKINVYESTTNNLLYQLRPDEVGGSGLYGDSIAIDGSILVVGASRDEEFGNNAGAVYMYDLANGSLITKLYPFGNQTQYFGREVAIDNGTVVATGQVDEQGFVYLYESGELLRVMTTAYKNPWGEVVALEGPVGIRDGFVVATSFGVSVEAFRQGGVFVFDASTGEELRLITAEDPSDLDLFGWSIDLDSHVLVVGAIDHWYNGARRGAAYIFNVDTGEQIAELLPPDSIEESSVGNSVDVCGDRVLVGSLYNPGIVNRAGAAYLYDALTGQLITKLVASDGMGGDAFGGTVSMYDNHIVVAAIADEDNGRLSGSAYLFSSFPCSRADVSPPFGSTDISDVNLFVSLFMSQDPFADFTGDGQFNFFDVSAFLAAFSAGCP
jgi:FG-GAP repeat protein